jgi:cytochrome c oxidase subunit 2
MERLLGLPELASAHGAALDRLTVWVHVLMALLFVGWTVFLVYALVRFRRKSNPRASYAGVQNHSARYTEYAVIAAEALLLIGFSIPLWSDRVDDFPSEHEATVVRVVGEQFAWNVHYPGPDGRFGRTAAELVDTQLNPLGLDHQDPAADDDVVTLNQLHLPVGKPALVHLTSKDVIHSFMLNEMRVKQDAIPGIETPVWFEPTVTTAQMRERTGDPDYDYEIACAQLCGLGHYRMRGFLTVEEPAAFEAWLATRRAEQQKPAGGSSIWN